MSDHKFNPTAQKCGGPTAPPARVKDAAGRVLDLGDEVLVLLPKMLMRVASIRPLLHPGAPRNSMALTLVCRVEVGVPRDSAIEDVYFTRHQSEVGDTFQVGPEAESPDAAPPVGDESGPAAPPAQVTLT